MNNFCTERIDDVLVDEEVKDIVLFNDDENTFDYVIDSLQLVCKHDLIQAQQCAFLAHYTGKCSVKTGQILSLEKFYNQLLNRGLSVQIM